MTPSNPMPLCPSPSSASSAPADGLPTAGACPAVFGYTAALYQDSIGSDLGQTYTMEAAAARCNADASCKGFNSGGWYKDSVTFVAASTHICLYIKQGEPTAVEAVVQ